MKRLFAAVIAIALIVGAAIARSVLDDDGASSAPVGSGGDAVHVVCADLLRVACAGLEGDVEVTYEDAAVTADRLATATDPELDAWVAPMPWPAMVDDTRARAGANPLFSDQPRPLARTRLAVVGPDDLEGCGWRCLGDRAAGELKLGSRPLATSGIGVLTLAAAVTGWFDGPTFATNDFDPDFERWLGGWSRRLEVSPDPLTRLLQARAFLDAAVELEATAEATLAAASPDRIAGLTLLYPAPVATVEAVLVSTGAGTDDLADRLASALEAAGWRTPDGQPLELPSPGVIVALRSKVR